MTALETTAWPEAPPPTGAVVLIGVTGVGLRAGLRAALEPAGFRICEDASDGPDVVFAAATSRPDVVVMSSRLPGGGIGVVSKVHGVAPGARVIVLSDSCDGRELLDAVRAGAVGYLDTGVDPSRLPVVVEAVVRGETAFPRALLVDLLDEVRRPRGPARVALPDGREVRLTARERSTAEALRAHRSTKDTAQTLGVSTVTVRRHISSLVHKLGAADRREAAALLEEARWS